MQPDLDDETTRENADRLAPAQPASPAETFIRPAGLGQRPTGEAAIERRRVSEILDTVRGAARLGIQVDPVEAIETGLDARAFGDAILREAAARSTATMIVSARPSAGRAGAGIVAESRRAAAEAQAKR